MRKIAFLRFLPLLFLTACAEIADEDSDALQSVSFSVIPSVAEDAGSGGLITTRAKVDGTFAAGSQVGLGIAGNSINNIYANFFARYNGTDWLYYLGGINNGTLLSGFTSWSIISIYGYYPYSSAVANLAAVPFRIASTPVGGVSYAMDDEAQTDYMVAGTKTKDMNDASGSTVSLAFAHLMTAIELNVNRQSYSTLPILKLDKVVYEINGGSRTFGVAGNYNAKNPNMTNMSANLTIDESANQLEVTYPSSANITSTSYSSRLLIIFPELRQTTGTGGADDAVVTLTFHFVDQDNSAYVFEANAPNPSVSFNLSAIGNGSGNDNGLLAGYTYTIQVSIGTYTKFTVPTGPTIIDNSLDETPPVFIEI